MRTGCGRTGVVYEREWVRWYEKDGKGNFKIHTLDDTQQSYDLRTVDMYGDLSNGRNTNPPSNGHAVELARRSRNPAIARRRIRRCECRVTAERPYDGGLLGLPVVGLLIPKTGDRNRVVFGEAHYRVAVIRAAGSFDHSDQSAVMNASDILQVILVAVPLKHG